MTSEVGRMRDPKELRETANAIGRAAASLTEAAFADGRDMAALGTDLNTLRQAADICGRMARRIEARKAQMDDTSPLCIGCQHRTDALNGYGCALALDTKEAVSKRRCPKYAAE